jgi:hypothetical protein
MTGERVIWRPNEISPEVWEAMSHADQIQWWKDRQDKTSHAKTDMKEAVILYNRGCITSMEFGSLVAKLAARDEFEVFFRECPPVLLALLKESLDDYGDDESKWPRTFHITSYFPWVTADEIEKLQRQEQEQIWNGIRILKEYFRGRR